MNQAEHGRTSSAPGRGAVGCSEVESALTSVCRDVWPLRLRLQRAGGFQCADRPGGVSSARADRARARWTSAGVAIARPSVRCVTRTSASCRAHWRWAASSCFSSSFTRFSSEGCLPLGTRRQGRHEPLQRPRFQLVVPRQGDATAPAPLRAANACRPALPGSSLPGVALRSASPPVAKCASPPAWTRRSCRLRRFFFMMRLLRQTQAAARDNHPAPRRPAAVPWAVHRTTPAHLADRPPAAVRSRVPAALAAAPVRSPRAPGRLAAGSRDPLPDAR